MLSPGYRVLLNIVSVLLAVFKRLRYYWSLSLCAEIGIISVLSLVICVPVFTTAVLSTVLKQELNDKSVKYHRSLFSIHAYYADNTDFTPLTYANAQYVSKWLEGQLSSSMHVKVTDAYLDVSTATYTWKPVHYASLKPPFKDIQLSIDTNNWVTQKTKLVEGDWPVYDPANSGPVPVAVYEGFADENFINVGDIYQLTQPDIKILVTGIFRAVDPNDLSWFYSPEITFRNKVWVPDAYFQNIQTTIISRPIANSSWYVIVDEQSLRFTDSILYSHALSRINASLSNILPGIKTDYSPLEQFSEFESRTQAIIPFFYVVGSPLILLALIFISLTSSIVIQQLEQETATMRGRGLSFNLLIFQNLVESLILFLVAIPFSILLGWFAATWIGRTRSFLQFTTSSDLVFSFTDIRWLWVGLLALFIMVTRLIPLLRIRRITVVGVKQQRSRAGTRPFWQRFYLDFLLLIPAAYIFWRSHHQLDQLKNLATQSVNIFEGQYDPLQFLASSIFIVAVSMIALRIFPLLVRFMKVIADRILSVGSYLAFSELTRRSQTYYNVMLLIMISVSVAVFSSSMAKTLNQWVMDSQYYRTGADLVIKEYEIQSPGSAAAGDSASSSSNPNAINGVESLISLERHLQLPGIEAATFVGKYNGSLTFGTGRIDCVLMAIDRLSFPTTAYFRPDFSSQSLGGLMNVLARYPKGVIVSRDFLKRSNLQLGDQLKVTAPVGLYDQGFDQDMVVVGTYDFFPTIYPTDTPVIILNTGTLFGYSEAAIGYDVWLKINHNLSVQSVLQNLQSVALKDQFQILVLGNAIEEIQKFTNKPEWLGLFGILSVGFILTGLLPCIGLILDSFANLRQNYIQLGILQAIGLSGYQTIVYLLLERLILVGAALSGGAGIGLLASWLFMPLLQITISPGTPVPPFQVRIGWHESSVLILGFCFVFLFAIISTIIHMVQIKIFQAVKMGETI